MQANGDDSVESHAGVIAVIYSRESRYCGNGIRQVLDLVQLKHGVWCIIQSGLEHASRRKIKHVRTFCTEPTGPTENTTEPTR